MYDIIKSVISAGGFKLAEIQRKIKKLYIWGDLTEEQADELLALAAQGASANAERPEVLDMLQRLSERLGAVELALAAQKDTETEQPEHEAWTAWDGISDKYKKGAIVSHNGQLWRSAYSGQNVWEPGSVGTESMWVAYTPETEEVTEDENA